MKRWRERWLPHGLFLKMFLVMVASIAAVSVLTSWTTIRVSERLFVDTFSITNTKVLQQMKSSFASFHTTIVNASSGVIRSGAIKQYLSEGDTDSLTMAKAYFNAINKMDQIVATVNMYEISILLQGTNGRSYATNRFVWPIGDEQLKRLPMTSLARQEPRRMTYHLYLPGIGDGGAAGDAAGLEPTIVVTKALLDQTGGDIYGTMYIAIRESAFQRFYENYTSAGNDVVVLDRSGLIVSSNNKPLIGERSDELLRQAEEIVGEDLDYKSVRVMGKDHIVLAEYLPFYDMYLVNLIDKRQALGKLVDPQAIALICVAIVAIGLIVVFMISRRLTKSLTRLVKQISTISKYDFDHYVTETGSYETRQLARAFNEMMDELREYVEKLVETQRKQRNAELAALQRQINPHFLYNTLTAIKVNVQHGSKEKAAETINSLITLLQNAVGNVSETVTIQEEIELLRHYVYINQARHGDRVKVNYFVAPDCMNARVPKLIVQPFIENAFFHAFRKKAEGYIYVLVSRSGNTLVCEVADNGDGMETGGAEAGELPATQGNRQLFTGIGIRNVHERLQLLYGESYGVRIASEPGQGTQATIKLPFLEDAI